MPKPINHLSEALRHLDRAVEELKKFDGNCYGLGGPRGAIEDAQIEIKECRDESSDLLDDLREVTG